MRVESMRVHDLEWEIVRGGSGPTVVVLHGPMTYSPAAPFLGLLADRASVLAPSLPGFGGSSRPDDLDTVYDLVQAVHDLLDTLPDERVTLIGCSFGGWIAAEVAVNASHRLARLILADPVGIKVGGREDRDIVHHFNTPPAELARLAWHDPGRQGPGLLGLGWQQQLERLADDEIVTAARNWDALCLYAWRPHQYNPQLKRWLRRIAVPTLLLWGEGDQIVRPSYGRAYADLIPGAQFEIVPGAGHHPDVEQPERFAERVARFMGLPEGGEGAHR